MVDAMRAMLDELMGKERDVPLSARSSKKVDFNDPGVCKYALVACCPHQLFVNTKSALGPCGFDIHEEHLEWPNIKAEYDKLDQREKDRLPYEHDLLRYLDQLIRDMDRKIVKNKERAAAESAPRMLRPDEQARIDELQARMREALDRSAKLGEEGDVDGSLAAAQLAETIKRQQDSLHRQLTMPERSMEVCDICGVFINSTDNEQRRLDHLLGKQYLGWKKIREVFAQLTAAAEERRRSGGSGGGERRSSRERDGRDERYRDERRERYDRSGGRDERYRERSPGRSRSYSRDGSGGGGRDYHGQRERDYQRAPPPRDGYGGSRGGGRDRDYGGERDYRDRRY